MDARETLNRINDAGISLKMLPLEGGFYQTLYSYASEGRALGPSHRKRLANALRTSSRKAQDIAAELAEGVKQ